MVPYRYMGDDGRAEFIQERFGAYLGDPFLNLGCRKNRLGGIGVDIQEGEGVDHVIDLNRPYHLLEYYSSTSIESVVLSHVLEHLDKPQQLLQVVRLLRPRYVLVGLPNEVNWIRRLHLLLGKVNGKWRVQPEDWDRHCYFFELQTAHDFVSYHLGEGSSGSGARYNLHDVEAPFFRMGGARFYTKMVQWLVETFGSDELRCRDWWGLYKRRSLWRWS